MKQGCGGGSPTSSSRPRCDPVDAAFAIAADEFDPLLVERALARDAGRGWQLDRLAAVSDLIAAEVRSRAESGPLDVTWDWAERIEAVLPVVDDPDVAELRARAEKAEALAIIVRSRISALVGSAGTGKTSMLEALCADPFVDAGGILLLAPTGKAAVQLASRTGKPAQNLAQFLRKYNRWDWDSGSYYTAAGEARYREPRTVVIDEASMLTEEMLAATLDALDQVDRLILCGDPASSLRSAQAGPLQTWSRFCESARRRRSRRGASNRTPASRRATGRCRTPARRCRGRLAVLPGRPASRSRRGVGSRDLRWRRRTHRDPHMDR